MMHGRENEDERLRSVALQNAQAILAARRRAEEDVIAGKEALEAKTHELQQSLAMMCATLEATTDGIVVTDDHLRITGSNRRYAEMFGVAPELVARGDHYEVLERISHCFADPAAFLLRVEEI
jgi:PAS domain-containing protein